MTRRVRVIPINELERMAFVKRATVESDGEWAYARIDGVDYKARLGVWPA